MSDFLGSLSRHLSRGFSIAATLNEDDFGFVESSELLAIRTPGGGKAFLVLPDRELEAKLPFPNLVAQLKDREGWVALTRGILVNPARVRKTRRDPKAGGFQLFLDTDRAIAVSDAFRESLESALGVNDLEHIEPFDMPTFRMMQLGIREFEKNILYMPKEELLEYFSPAAGGEAVISELLVNFLWQQVNYIRAGQPSPVEGGNIRSLWYLVKPVLSRLGILDETNHYKTLSQKLGEMVSYKILSYREFALLDDGKWSIGQVNPHLVLMSEKTSHYFFLQQMQAAIGATIISTGGQPSTITSEYFTAELRKVVPNYWEKDRMAVLALVDYDPFGWNLLETFIDDLRIFGFKHPTVINLSIPANYTAEDLSMNHYDLITAADTPAPMLKKWMKKTNGIDGKPWGMEVDVLMMHRPQVKDLILTQGKPWIKRRKKTP